MIKRRKRFFSDENLFKGFSLWLSALSFCIFSTLLFNAFSSSSDSQPTDIIFTSAKKQLKLDFQSFDYDEIGKAFAEIKRLIKKDNKFDFALEAKDGIFWTCSAKSENLNCIAEIYEAIGSSTLHIKRTDSYGRESFACLSVKDYFYFEASIEENFYPEYTSLLFNKLPSSNIPLVEQLEYISIGEFHIPVYNLVGRNTEIFVSHLSEQTFASIDKSTSKINLLDSSEKIDSLIIMTKDSNGVFSRCKTNLNGLISQVEACSMNNLATSFYILFEDSHKQKYGAVFSLSEKPILYLENITTLKNTFNIRPNDFRCPEIVYNPGKYYFSWGDIALTIMRNSNGAYKAKSKIPMSKWLSIMNHSPVVSFSNEANASEEYSVQVKLENRVDSTMSGVNFGRFYMKDYSTNDKVSLKDTLQKSENTDIGSKLFLTDFKYYDEIEDDLEVEIEIVEDIKLEKVKRFQFHWKHIDTTFILNKNKGYYEMDLELELNDLISCLKFEPVLTSSKEGVIWDYEFDVVRIRGDEKKSICNINCSIENTSKFEESLQLEDFIKQIKVGDLLVLNNFKAKEIASEEELVLNIKILDDKLNSDDFASGQIYINWGDYKLKATDLANDNTKKFFTEQTISQNKLLEICEKNLYIVRNNIKESVSSADLVLTNRNEKISCTKNDNSWKYCLSKIFTNAKNGDHINMFLRSSSGNSALMQVYVESPKMNEDILGFGMSSDFDTLLFKYAAPLRPAPLKKLDGYSLNWGETFELPIKLIGNPNVHGGYKSLTVSEFEYNLGKELRITDDQGHKVDVLEASLSVYFSNDSRRRIGYILECYNGNCSLSQENLEDLMKNMNESVTSARIYIDEHEQDNINGKISYFNLFIDNPNGPWRPKNRLKRFFKLDEVFGFQFVYNEKGNSLLKIDVENPKYQWMIEKYKTDKNVDIVNIPNFKTIERTINLKDKIVSNQELKHVEVLTGDYRDINELADFHEFGGKEIDISWKNFKGRLNTETYCLEDFVCGEGPLEILVGSRKLNIKRGELIIVPEKGKAIKYVFDDIDDFEIEKRLKKLKGSTSLYLTKIIVDENGELLRFPLSVAFHLE